FGDLLRRLGRARYEEDGARPGRGAPGASEPARYATRPGRTRAETASAARSARASSLALSATRTAGPGARRAVPRGGPAGSPRRFQRRPRSARTPPATGPE